VLVFSSVSLPFFLEFAVLRRPIGGHNFDVFRSPHRRAASGITIKGVTKIRQTKKKEALRSASLLDALTPWCCSFHLWCSSRPRHRYPDRGGKKKLPSIEPAFLSFGFLFAPRAANACKFSS
jgi:hypothetical protein